MTTTRFFFLPPVNKTFATEIQILTILHSAFNRVESSSYRSINTLFDTLQFTLELNTSILAVGTAWQLYKLTARKYINICASCTTIRSMFFLCQEKQALLTSQKNKEMIKQFPQSWLSPEILISNQAPTSQQANADYPPQPQPSTSS